MENILSRIENEIKTATNEGKIVTNIILGKKEYTKLLEHLPKFKCEIPLTLRGLYNINI